LALWNFDNNAAVNEFEVFADNNGVVSDGLGTSLGTFDAIQPQNFITISPQIFFFSVTETRFVHLDITSNHGNNLFVNVSEVAFRQVPTEVFFEFGHVPVIVFVVAVGGINYFWNKKGK